MDEMAANDAELRAIGAFDNRVSQLTVEQEKLFELQERFAKSQDAAEKKRIKKEITQQNDRIKREKKNAQTRKKIQAETAAFNKRVAEETFQFGQALLAKEEGAFIKFLASKLRQLTQYLAKKLYIEGLAAFPKNPALGLALFAAGGAVQVAGELGAQALDAEADKAARGSDGETANTFAENVEQAQADEIGGNVAAGAGGTVINNYDNSNNVEIIETGTYISEADFIRNRVKPTIDQIDTEQGRITFS